MNEEFILVSDITDIELNQSQTVQLGDENILICHTETGVYAVEDKCSHAEIFPFVAVKSLETSLHVLSMELFLT